MVLAMIKMMVLKELNSHEQSGYDLMKKISMRSNKPSPGYIYPLLRSLEERGFVSCTEEKRRKVYRISREGRKFLNKLQKTHEHAMHFMVKNFEPISTKEEMKELFKVQATMTQNKDKLMGDMDIMHKLQHAIFSIYEKNYENKRSKLRSILKKTTQQLEKLSKQ